MLPSAGIVAGFQITCLFSFTGPQMKSNCAQIITRASFRTLEHMRLDEIWDLELRMQWVGSLGDVGMR